MADMIDAVKLVPSAPEPRECLCDGILGSCGVTREFFRVIAKWPVILVENSLYSLGVTGAQGREEVGIMGLV